MGKARFVRVPSIPSANILIGWHRTKSFGRFSQLKRCYAGHILPARVGRVLPTGKVALELKRYCARKYDPENFIAGAKYFVDELVRSGLLVNDTEQYLEATYSQIIAPPNHRKVEAVLRYTP
jgi:hypothetical protein